MIRREEVYKIGVLNKPHGIHGELAFTFTDDIFDRVEAEYIVCLLGGIFVPFFIEEYRFRSETTALIKLEDIDTAEQARRFTGIEVYFPVHHTDELPPEELTWDIFEGFRMEEIHHGYIGDITDVDTTTVNTLFVVDRGGEELLVPAREEFITDIDRQHRILTVNLPEGLLTLNETYDKEEEDEEAT
ncbi:MAG: ribosome maturation factor RimM [Mediterranea sp.]|jgi:16S rRNA processing protein RimM|nr:ribosome maturation factor RimM [Mediterranea sp.]